MWPEVARTDHDASKCLKTFLLGHVLVVFNHMPKFQFLHYIGINLCCSNISAQYSRPLSEGANLGGGMVEYSLCVLAFLGLGNKKFYAEALK